MYKVAENEDNMYLWIHSDLKPIVLLQDLWYGLQRGVDDRQMAGGNPILLVLYSSLRLSYLDTICLYFAYI